VIETHEHADESKEWRAPGYFAGEAERINGRLESSSPLNDVKDQHDDGNYEQKMDQASANVADETKKPENDQNDNYSPEHGYSFRLS
jgi:hypothetical protein